MALCQLFSHCCFTNHISILHFRNPKSLNAGPQASPFPSPPEGGEEGLTAPQAEWEKSSLVSHPSLQPRWGPEWCPHPFLRTLRDRPKAVAILPNAKGADVSRAKPPETMNPQPFTHASLMISSHSVPVPFLPKGGQAICLYMLGTPRERREKRCPLYRVKAETRTRVPPTADLIDF